MGHGSYIGWIPGPNIQDGLAKKVINMREKYCLLRAQETDTRRLMARRARRARRRITGDQIDDLDTPMTGHRISGGSLLKGPGGLKDTS